MRRRARLPGRWDITVTTPRRIVPRLDGTGGKRRKTRGRIQPRAGSVHPAADVKLDGAHLVLTVSAAGCQGACAHLEPGCEGRQTHRRSAKRRCGEPSLAGVRAPELKREPPQAWTDAQPLFDGKDLNGWEPTTPSATSGGRRDGTLLDTKKGANIKTTPEVRRFQAAHRIQLPGGRQQRCVLRGALMRSSWSRR